MTRVLHGIEDVEMKIALALRRLTQVECLEL